MITRRTFFSALGAATGLSVLLPGVNACSGRVTLNPELHGPRARLGHRLRTMDFPVPDNEITTGVMIIGGGVSGLSAARYLSKNGVDFLLAELESSGGGNAAAGRNPVSAFPLGAHYLPVPGIEDTELLSFLEECGSVTRYKSGIPVYNEYHLCHDPKERLYINNLWQEGIIPFEGVPAKDRGEIERFLQMMQKFREMKGPDGFDAFAIPVSRSSRDPELISLDRISAATFLKENRYTSPHLFWYAGYCCADDYGSSLEDTSAWAMIHYFASRKGVAANAGRDDVLTWPEGNNFLVRQLEKSVGQHQRNNLLVYRVEEKGAMVEVLAYDAVKDESVKIKAAAAIVCVPQFVAQHIVKGRQNFNYEAFQYAPWMVANITSRASFTERRGEPLCWDNVIYGSSSLGYVNSSQQSLSRTEDEKVITFYKPLLGEPVSERKAAFSRTIESWTAEIISELNMPHPGINRFITGLDVWVWGHGMIRPSPGFIWGDDREVASRPLGRIHFAHSDIGGISVFEEAFYQGYNAAISILKL